MLLSRVFAVVTTFSMALVLAACQATPPAPAPPSATAAPATAGPGATAAPVTAVQSATSAPVTASSGAPTSGGRVVFAWNADGKSLVPYQQTFSVERAINQHIFETLVAYDEIKKDFVPGLAESWQTSADGLTWTFKLRQGVTFHDGTPFDAKAAKFTLDTIVDPKSNASPFTTGFLAGYESSEAVDDATLQVTFKTPNGRFIDGLSSPNMGIVSPTSIQTYGEDVARHPVGTGPFAFKEWVAGDHITIVRNPNYKGVPGFTHAGPAYLDEILFRIITDDGTRAAALERGEADLAFLSFADNPRFQADKNFKMYVIVRPGTVRALQFNTEKGVLQDLAVRKAISAAIDSESIAKAPFLGNAAVVARTPLSPEMFGYDKSLEQLAAAYDPAKARQILDDAGWRVGAGGVREKDGQPLAIKFRTVRLTLLDQVALLVQAQLKDVGVRADLELAPDWGVLLPVIKSGDYEMMIGGSFQSDLGILNVNYDPAQINQSFLVFSRIPDQTLAQLLKQGESTTDLEQRRAVYRQVQERIMQQVALTPMYVEPYVFGAKPTLAGLRTNREGEPRFNDAFIQHV